MAVVEKLLRSRRIEVQQVVALLYVDKGSEMTSDMLGNKRDRARLLQEQARACAKVIEAAEGETDCGVADDEGSGECWDKKNATEFWNKKRPELEQRACAVVSNTMVAPHTEVEHIIFDSPEEVVLSDSSSNKDTEMALSLESENSESDRSSSSVEVQPKKKHKHQEKSSDARKGHKSKKSKGR